MVSTRRCWSQAIALTVCGFCMGASTPFASAQPATDRMSIGQIHEHIRSISPTSGPHGTVIRVEVDGLDPHRNYQVAVGEMQGCGYQICEPARASADGTLVASIVVPDWTHTEHFEVVMILTDEHVPVAVSDPFHVTTAEGLVQREGVVGTAWPGCPSLETEHGVTYALVGTHAKSLLASQGHAMILEGRVVEGTCTQQYALEVISMKLVPERD